MELPGAGWWPWRGGDFMGIPPTGKRVTIRVMDFVRYREG